MKDYTISKRVTMAPRLFTKEVSLIFLLSVITPATISVVIFLFGKTFFTILLGSFISALSIGSIIIADQVIYKPYTRKDPYHEKDIYDMEVISDKKIKNKIPSLEIIIGSVLPISLSLTAVPLFVFIISSSAISKSPTILDAALFYIVLFITLFLITIVSYTKQENGAIFKDSTIYQVRNGFIINRVKIPRTTNIEYEEDYILLEWRGIMDEKNVMRINNISKKTIRRIRDEIRKIRTLYEL